MNPMHSRPTDDTTKSPRSKWLTARSKMLSPATLAHVASSREERTPAQKTADKLLAQKSLATTQSGQSGLFQGQETKKIRQKFLTFTLLLSVLIVTVLAGFGTVASTEAQLQTVRLLGQSLLRSIRGDLSSLIFYTEREVTHFAINGIHSIQITICVRVIEPMPIKRRENNFNRRESHFLHFT